MKDKNVAGLLALFLGWLGVHRFYLGQPGLGVLYLILFWFPLMWIIYLVDAVAFFSMNRDVFDHKYNNPNFSEDNWHRRRHREHERRRDGERRWEERRQREARGMQGGSNYQRPAAPAPSARPAAPVPVQAQQQVAQLKTKGIQQFKEYDFYGARDNFEKALKQAPNDVAVHFNLACTYSMLEEPLKAFFHLDRAFALGFKDEERVRTHDSLAYLRAEQDFPAFADNHFRLTDALKKRLANDGDSSNDAPAPAAPEGSALPEPAENLLDSQPSPEVDLSPGLLEQIKKLGELRDMGFLTEAEFADQKRRLLS